MKENKRYIIVISNRTKEMLEEHIYFIAKVNKNAARNTKDKLLKAIRSLEEMPERFLFFEAKYIASNKYHKMVIEKNYIILFQIKDRVVYVDYIIDCRKEYSWLIK